MTNTIAKSREHEAFVVEETTKGTLAYPTAAAELMILTEQATLEQGVTFTDSKEINNSLDVLERFQDRIGSGSWSLSFYLRPSGTAGTAPMGDILFESLMGTKATVGGTSVTYSQALTKPSFSIWFKRGHTCYYGSGACAETMKMPVSNKGAVEFSFSGGFMKKGWAGTDAANGATANGTGTGYVVNLLAGYSEGDTVIQVDTGSGTILEGDAITFAGDATTYFVAEGGGFAGDGEGTITLRAPGLTASLADGTALTIAGNSKITVTNGKLFTADALVQIADDTNTNAGYGIYSVSTNDLYMKEAVTCADEAVVKGFIPTGLTAVGTPVESKNSSIAFDGSDKVLKSITYNVNSPVEWQDEEITTSGYVESYVESKRAITIDTSLLFREQDLELFYDALNDTRVSVVTTIDDGAGSICTLTNSSVEFDEPKEQPGENTVSLNLTGSALGTSGEDSMTIVFT
jgi:hypothetical protein